MRSLLLLIALTFPLVSFAQQKKTVKLTPAEIERRCQAMTSEKRASIKACNTKKQGSISYYTSGDPYLGKVKETSGYVLKIQGQGGGEIRGLEGSMGYVFSQMEVGVFGGSISSKENSDVGEFTGSVFGGYVGYNYMPVSLRSQKKINATMVFKLGSSSLDVKQTGSKENYPYIGLGANVAVPMTSNFALTVGADLHQIIHPEKNLFHLGSSLGLGLRFDF